MSAGPNLPGELRRRFWKLLSAGMFTADAAAACSVSSTTGFRWVQEAGGVNPYSTSELSGSRLSFAERQEIGERREAGETMKVIGEALGRSPSTVSRELLRGLRAKDGRYRPSVAQVLCDQRAERPKPRKLAGNQRLRNEVQHRLNDKKHSPEQISQRLRLDFPDEPEMRVSPETIYRSLYVQGQGALRRELSSCLRTGRTIRRPRRSEKTRQHRKIPGMVNISERPAEVEDRSIPGHWEGDLIVGSKSMSAIGTLVERTTRFTMLLHLPDGHSAPEVERAMITAMTQLPAALRRTLTWDQGTELTNHVRIAAATELAIYFCDPHSPWQRGTNENTNGLLRQYFPKSTDLSGYHADYLTFVADQLNDRPRKTLGWKTPSETLKALVATTA